MTFITFSSTVTWYSFVMSMILDHRSMTPVLLSRAASKVLVAAMGSE